MADRCHVDATSRVCHAFRITPLSTLSTLLQHHHSSLPFLFHSFIPPFNHFKTTPFISSTTTPPSTTLLPPSLHLPLHSHHHPTPMNHHEASANHHLPPPKHSFNPPLLSQPPLFHFYSTPEPSCYLLPDRLLLSSPDPRRSCPCLALF